MRRLVCLVLGHRWQWLPRSLVLEGEHFWAAANAVCRRCGEQTWAHGRRWR